MFHKQPKIKTLKETASVMLPWCAPVPLPAAELNVLKVESQTETASPAVSQNISLSLYSVKHMYG